MIDFVVVSSDLQLFVLGTWVKRGRELSTDHRLVVSCRTDQWGSAGNACLTTLWKWPSYPTSHRASTTSQKKWGAGCLSVTVFHDAIVELAARSWNSNMLVLVMAVTPEWRRRFMRPGWLVRLLRQQTATDRPSNPWLRRSRRQKHT